MKTLILTLFISLLFSCKTDRKVEAMKSNQVARLEMIANFSFRKSYANHENLTGKELDSLMNTKPLLLPNFDKKNELLLNLNKLNLITDNFLNELLFENEMSSRESFLDINKNILFSYRSKLAESNTIILNIKRNKIIIEKEIDFGAKNFGGILLEDLDDDGTKEILILENYYIMNGENFDLSIIKFVE
uniref:hypothetical protein n=2 Tax=Flavobacterium sp. TaxID=239 RepID=UPI00404A56A8